MVSLTHIPTNQMISVREVGVFLRNMNYCYSSECFLAQHGGVSYLPFAALQEWFEDFFPTEDSQFLLMWFWQSHHS